MFFQLLSTIKVNFVDEMIQSTYLCYFAYQAQKLTIHRDFNLISNSWWNPRWRQRWRLLLVTSKTQRPLVVLPLKKYTSSFWEDQRISTKDRIIILQHIKNSTVEGSINSPSLLCTTMGVWICVYVRGLRAVWVWLYCHLEQANSMAMCACFAFSL